METELIDLDAKTSSYIKPSFPHGMYIGFGGILNENILICGGFYGFRLQDCYFWNLRNGETFNQSFPLLEPRSEGDGVMTTKGLWVTGGRTNNGLSKTTEFITLDRVIPGPNLPEEICCHCLTRINSTVIAMTGGSSGPDRYSPKTYFFHEDSQHWTRGPDMKESRYRHGCSIINNAGKQYLIVAGGYNGERLNSTEFLEIGTLGTGTANWVKGPILPEPMQEFRMVPTADSLGTIIIGGYDDSSMRSYRDEVLELKCETSLLFCTWSSILSLKSPRGELIAIPIARNIFKIVNTES